jgi:hypothetical protein
MDLNFVINASPDDITNWPVKYSPGNKLASLRIFGSREESNYATEMVNFGTNGRNMAILQPATIDPTMPPRLDRKDPLLAMASSSTEALRMSDGGTLRQSETIIEKAVIRAQQFAPLTTSDVES